MQIIPTTKGISGKLEKELGGSGNAAGQKAGAGFLSGIGGTIAKGAAAIGAAATTAVSALTKSIVSSYADYEQLVGGIETLFDASEANELFRQVATDAGLASDEIERMISESDAIALVMNNAANAYKTAGLSANQYMETVTSFSAALISSVEGDTYKAGEIADIAITDMADNANKMGTSMESIQSAYQGFAKQNYTMLDNLKLGYGGTKSEMERLLADATAISGKKYDIDSLADVYRAIHIIQNELGITGATAKEASTTISGSVTSMKATWQNLLVGMADDNADFSGLVDNLVNSIVGENGEGGVINNIMPRVKKAMQGIGQLIQELAPVITEALPGLIESILPGLIGAAVSLLTGFGDALITSLPLLIDAAIQIVSALAQGLMDNLPAIIDAAITLITTLGSGLAENLPTLIPAAIKAISTIATALIDNIDQLVSCAIELMIGLANGIIEALPELIAQAPVIIAALIAALVENIPLLIQSGIDMIGKLIEGLIENLPALWNAALDIIDSLVGGISDLWDSIVEIGKNLVEGIWDGISGAADWLWEQVKGFFSGVIDSVKNFLGIHSPSKVFAELGSFMAEGLGVGFGDEIDSVKDDITSDVNGIVSSVSGIGMSVNGYDYAGIGANGNASGGANNATFNLTLDGEVISTFFVDMMRKEVRMA